MKKESSMQKLFAYAGNYKYLTIASWILSEHPAEGVYFQSHIRITLQINKDILELVSLLRQVAARCAGWH